ncbi:MAG: hypothetical protein II520_02610, partial [Bacilli bacterium]|nr:hypothetical protein [Bacilli bacterium]
DNLKNIAEDKGSTFNTPVFRGSGHARTTVGRLMEACLESDDLATEIDQLFAASVEDSESYVPKN